MIHRDNLICQIVESLELMSNDNLAKLFNSLDSNIEVAYDQDDLFITSIPSSLTESEQLQKADIENKWEATKAYGENND